MSPELMPAALLLGLAALGGYLLGSIPFGLVLTRMAGLGDIRTIGSGNIGATNVLRTGNKFLAFLTLILDSGKGAAAALIAATIFTGQTGSDQGDANQLAERAILLAGFCGVLGHNFPVWLKFKGGKGVATTLGVILAVSPTLGVATCAVWLLVAGISRYSSLAAMVALASTPALAYLLNASLDMVLMTAGLAVLALVRHKENIGRLMRGEESKIGGNKSKSP